MFAIGIDTSNYATSLAVFCTKTQSVVYDKKIFLPVKKGALGLRQSDALFHHTVALPKMMQSMREFLNNEIISAVGVSSKPRMQEGSYMPCFLAGVNAATALCAGSQIPLVELSHQQCHITAAAYASGVEGMYTNKKLVFHISGGTTEILLCEGFDSITKLGGTTDLYAGQAIDRIGVKLGFSFPAGAQMSDIAQHCDENLDIKVSVKNFECSFSGLENKCSKLIDNNFNKDYVAKYCLLHVAKTVCEIVKNAKKIYNNIPVLCVGGVMSSGVIKSYVQNEIEDVYFVQSKYSSDNAIGAAVYAAKKLLE